MSQATSLRISAIPFVLSIFVALSTTASVQADVFNDLIDIVIDDLDAGVTVAGAAGVMPDPFDLELEHMGAGGFDVDITPLDGCDFLLRIGHFAPIDGAAVGAFDWQLTDIHMRDDDGDILFAKITDIEIPAPELNAMPTTELFFTDWVVSCRTGGFPSSTSGAFNDYIVRVAVIGDVNQDCDINLLDVGPFVELLGTGGYSVQADINQDGALNLLDVSEFINLLSE